MKTKNQTTNGTAPTHAEDTALLRELLALCAESLDDGTHGRLVLRVREALNGKGGC